ncbi:MAG: ATP-binding protein [Terracidiphilus sp.]
MSSETVKTPMRSAAWRISLWATLAFACGTMAAFAFLHGFVSSDIQRRSDAWLSGEVEVLGDVAERTPKDALYGRVVSEVAELAAREVPNRNPEESAQSDSVFFLQVSADGKVSLWVGAGNSQDSLRAIRASNVSLDRPTDVRIQGIAIPYRVAADRIEDGSMIYLGLSERDQLRVLRNLRLRFILIWLLLVFLGFALVFFTTWRMLSHVRRIADAASRIGHSDLSERVPTTKRHDEVSHLAVTLNGMLDRIEKSVHQLHTITGSLAHDLQSPLTAIRGKLEMSLSASDESDQSEPVIAAIDELDRLTNFLNMSLDVAEAKADALRLNRSAIDLHELLRSMVDLYEPSMTERGIAVDLHGDEDVEVRADEGLIHRMVANLLENELKHLPAESRVTLTLRASDGGAAMTLEDNGPGFDPAVEQHLLERRVKGPASTGHGLGLAFVDAVVRAHGGRISAGNRPQGGARIQISLPRG